MVAIRIFKYLFWKVNRKAFSPFFLVLCVSRSIFLFASNYAKLSDQYRSQLTSRSWTKFLSRLFYFKAQWTSTGAVYFGLMEFWSNFKNYVGFQIIQINQPTRRNKFSTLLLDVYVQLNMFRASSRPSSGAQQLQ